MDQDNDSIARILGEYLPEIMDHVIKARAAIKGRMSDEIFKWEVDSRRKIAELEMRAEQLRQRNEELKIIATAVKERL